ncbi:hypothetical protein HDV64DRAFT_246257 [Trichoderma sp. TUCIM 5745]
MSRIIGLTVYAIFSCLLFVIPLNSKHFGKLIFFLWQILSIKLLSCVASQYRAGSYTFR